MVLLLLLGVVLLLQECVFTFLPVQQSNSHIGSLPRRLLCSGTRSAAAAALCCTAALHICWHSCCPCCCCWAGHQLPWVKTINRFCIIKKFCIIWKVKTLLVALLLLLRLLRLLLLLVILLCVRGLCWGAAGLHAACCAEGLLCLCGVHVHACAQVEQHFVFVVSQQHL
jgi:hypothetical protein